MARVRLAGLAATIASSWGWASCGGDEAIALPVWDGGASALVDVAAEGPTGDAAVDGADKGSLSVSVAADSGLVFQLAVKGPNSFNTTFNAPTTLIGLVPGSYDVLATTGRMAGPLVDTFYTVEVSGTPATVIAGQTASVNVVYAKRPASGSLWIATARSSGGDALLGYLPAQLSQSGNVAPGAEIWPTAAKELDSPRAIAIAPDGGLWVGGCRSLVHYPIADMLASGSPTPNVIVTLPSFNCFDALTFDRFRNAWVSDGKGTIALLGAGQLATSGNALVTATSKDPTLRSPRGFAFDTLGNLWIANAGDGAGSGGSVAMYSVGRIQPSETGVADAGADLGAPDVVLSGANFYAPTALAFAKNGTLWVADEVLDVAYALSPAQITVSGNPVPGVILTGAALSGPSSIAFDNGGDIWIANRVGATLVKIDASALASSGSPAAAVTIEPLPVDAGSAVGAPISLAFDPSPPWSVIP